MTDFGVEVRTVNLCQQCYNESLTAQGLAPLKNWQWKTVAESASWQTMENAGERPAHARNWEFLSFERAKAKKFLNDAKKEKQEGIQGQWQRESPAKEYLEQVRSSADTDCTPKLMKYGYFG